MFQVIWTYSDWSRTEIYVAIPNLQYQPAYPQYAAWSKFAASPGSEITHQLPMINATKNVAQEPAVNHARPWRDPPRLPTRLVID